MSEPSYTISPDGKSLTCGLCQMTSHNLNDVRELFCGRCKIFLDDEDAVARRRAETLRPLVWRPEMKVPV